jgi:hypothetical protein
LTEETKRAGDPIALRAGPLEVMFQDGALHTFVAFGVEVWRGVMFLHRDATWRTSAVAVRDLRVTAREASFHLTFDARCAMSGATLAWHAVVEGDTSGSIRFAVEAQPDADVPTNRTGLCVLHPLSAAGSRLEIEHADGRLSHSTFPTLISPWQPFTQIRALRHEFLQGCWARCRLDGDVFEMEDQRNFSDASYKTYSRSNLMPRPYRLAAGERIRQSATLTLEACEPVRARPRTPDPCVEITRTRIGRLPRIGLSLARLTAGCAARPGLWHASIDRTAAGAESRDEVQEIQRWAAVAGVAIELLLANDREAAQECRNLSERLSSVGVTPESIAVFPTTRRSVSAARAAFTRSLVGGGTPWFFTDLNRATLPAELDFITFRTCPIVHVADDRSVMQTLSTLPSIIATLRERHPGVAFRVGPASISMNVNPFGAWPEATDGTPVAMARDDPRDHESFGVAWGMGYLARLASGGADVVSFASPTVFTALASLAQLAGAGLLDATVSDDTIAALAFETPRGIEAWMANLTDRPARATLRIAGENRRTLAVAPYGLARVDVSAADSRVDR